MTKFTVLLLAVGVSAMNSARGADPGSEGGAMGSAVAIKPEVIVKRRMDFPAQPKKIVVVFGEYIGGSGLDMYETRSFEIGDDIYSGGHTRYSKDSGKTWSEWAPDKLFWYWSEKDGVKKMEYRSSMCYDPQSGMVVQLSLEEVNYKGALYHHLLYRLANDNGYTLGPARVVKYEAGADYDPNNWANEDYLFKNRMQGAYNVIVLKNGDLAMGAFELPGEVVNEDGTIEKIGQDYNAYGPVAAMCLIGKWNPESKGYDWRGSQRIAVSSKISSRGMLESWAVQLKNGDLLMDMRGSNTSVTPGRHWYAISKDNGLTWGKVNEWKFNDGAQFYSPSSLAKILRHSKTGELYWFGNISPTPPSGNSPRNPLYIAEIDESMIALKRDTLVVIDQLDLTKDKADLQFSNFGVYENRITHDYEMYMPLFGEVSGNESGTARYTIRVMKP